MKTSATLITGASAGIGLEMAKVFAKKGHNLVLVARREPQLAALAESLRAEHGTQCFAMPENLAAEGACQRLCDKLAEDDIDIDVLVNNAGVLSGGAFRRSHQHDIDNMIALNIAALTRLCRLFLDPMVARGKGRIMNIASIAAFQPVPSLAVYSATKAYVLSFTEALAVELSGKGVTATAFCPGFTDTDMMRDEQGRTTIPKALVMRPDRVARAAYAACMRGDVVEIPGLVNTIASTGAQIMPRWLLRGLSGAVVRGGSRKS